MGYNTITAKAFGIKVQKKEITVIQAEGKCPECETPLSHLRQLKNYHITPYRNIWRFLFFVVYYTYLKNFVALCPKH
ncbi:MAG: hypothetical protein HYW78_00950 [Parcubacteria group bacterium]|nr:hypothetical protein [Parcubacteria group bacterium]